MPGGDGEMVGGGDWYGDDYAGWKADVYADPEGKWCKLEKKKKKRKKEKKGYIETVDRLGSCCMYCTLWKWNPINQSIYSNQSLY